MNDQNQRTHSLFNSFFIISCLILGLSITIFSVIVHSKKIIHLQKQEQLRSTKTNLLTEDEELPKTGIKLRHASIWLLISIIFSLIIALFLIAYLMNSRSSTYTKLLLASSGLLILGTILLLRYSKKDIFSQESAITELLTSEDVRDYIDTRNAVARARNVAPLIPITFGINVYSISITSENLININGHMWQRYPKNHNPGIRFPQATKLNLNKLYEKEDGDTTIVGWDINADFQQKIDYTKYPFDYFNVQIFVQPQETTPAYIFIPDPKQDNFLGKKTTIAAFNVIHSFFAYTKQPYQKELINKSKQLSPRGLTLHMKLHRKLINPLITDLIPLIIVFLSIFLIKLFGDGEEQLVTVEDEKKRIGKLMEIRFSLVGAYTALFFSLILLHLRIRSIVTFDSLLYIENFFFCAYSALFIYLLSTLIVSNHRNVNTPLTTRLYWPMQSLIWFIFTIITFYNP